MPVVRSPYHGSRRQLAIAFDVGTTFSGVSYSILDPGEVPKIFPVTMFPCQEQAGGDSKIPTIIYYDKRGNACSVGAEAMQEDILEKAEDEGWTKVEWFKLHLRPKALSAKHITDQDIPPLPKNKTAVDIFADFLRYLFKCTETFIKRAHANGDSLWKSLKGHIHFILSHPNGWEGAQQGQMRRAAIQAGLIRDTPEDSSRLQFVTEGEASLHFCVESKLSSAEVTTGKGVIVVDAGGGTIDLSAYYMKRQTEFDEIAPTECRLQGSVFISRRARSYLEAKLHGSRYGTPEDINSMTDQFDKSTKTKFRDSTESSHIKFGSNRDNDPAVGIKNGQLKLSGADVAKLFEPSITATLDAIIQQRNTASQPIKAIFLVGGFAASNWLFSKLQESLKPFGVSFCRPDQNVNKAVADGAISFYLNHFVSARVAKWTYGIASSADYNSLNPEHLRRAGSLYTFPSGRTLVPEVFSAILRKGTSVSETTEFKSPYCWEDSDLSKLGSVTTPLLCYRGSRNPAPDWVDVEPEKFPTLCRIIVDTSQWARSLVAQQDTKGNRYYYMEYNVVLLFGLTELKAQLSWTENGKEKRSPATIVYDNVEEPEVDHLVSASLPAYSELPASASQPSRNSPQDSFIAAFSSLDVKKSGTASRRR